MSTNIHLHTNGKSQNAYWNIGFHKKNKKLLTVGNLVYYGGGAVESF